MPDARVEPAGSAARFTGGPRWRCSAAFCCSPLVGQGGTASGSVPMTMGTARSTPFLSPSYRPGAADLALGSSRRLVSAFEGWRGLRQPRAPAATQAALILSGVHGAYTGSRDRDPVGSLLDAMASTTTQTTTTATSSAFSNIYGSLSVFALPRTVGPLPAQRQARADRGGKALPVVKVRGCFASTAGRAHQAPVSCCCRASPRFPELVRRQLGCVRGLRDGS